MKFFRLAPLVVALALLAQVPSRDEYRRAYQSWRQSDPTLEPDAASAGAAIAPRAQKAATEAAAFIAARAAFLDAGAARFNQQQKSLEEIGARPRPLVSKIADTQRVILRSSQSLDGVISSLAGDTDAAIRQLRDTLSRERIAVNTLSDTVSTRLRLSEESAQATAALESTFTAALNVFRDAAAAKSRAADQVRKEGAAWQTYYQLLAEGAQGIGPTSSVPVRGGAPVPPPAPKDIPRSTVPLVRYIGAWTFPEGGLYFGAQPQTIDMTVREQNGRVTGTLNARFILPPGSPGDPALRFDFEGMLGADPVQKFSLRTPDGATGTIDLIPGAAFNLLEVNFQITGAANRVRAGNFVLLKK